MRAWQEVAALPAPARPQAAAVVSRTLQAAGCNLQAAHTYLGTAPFSFVCTAVLLLISGFHQPILGGRDAELPPGPACAEGLPYCGPAEAVTLLTAAQHCTRDSGEQDRQLHALQCYRSAGKYEHQASFIYFI